VPVGELQSTLARTTDYDWSTIGPPTHLFLSRRETWLLELRLTACERRD